MELATNQRYTPFFFRFSPLHMCIQHGLGGQVVGDVTLRFTYLELRINESFQFRPWILVLVLCMCCLVGFDCTSVFYPGGVLREEWERRR
jgi:hypothetical protein